MTLTRAAIDSGQILACPTFITGDQVVWADPDNGDYCAAWTDQPGGVHVARYRYWSSLVGSLGLLPDSDQWRRLRSLPF